MSLAVEILSTGDELLSGQLVDTNSPWLMDRLWDLGILVRRKTLVGDDRDDLLEVLREAAARSDVVVMSGGLGPTEDDLTAECLAAAMGVPLELDAASLQAIEERFARLGRTMTPNNAKQARFPRGATVLPNRFGTAPGFIARLARSEVVCLPGVPVEFKGLCDEAVLPRLAARVGERPAARLVKLFGIPESHADQRMRPVMDSHADAKFGYRAHWPEIHVKWRVSGPGADARADAILDEVRGVFGDVIWAEDPKAELPEIVVARLVERGEKVAVAESCTGGMVSQLLTRVPGASSVFDVGLVTYSNLRKTDFLGVPPEVLRDHGAVSEPVARIMAEGARVQGRSTWGIGITGIAGPSGATAEKPLGTVHLALAGPGGTQHAERRYPGDRERVRRSAALDALNLLRVATR
jgi:nicotinamide-nucleotide amidase